MSSLSPYITVAGASAAIDFYVAVFDAQEGFRLVGPDGKIGHAQVMIGDSELMIADEYPDFGALSPVSVGGTPVALHVYVDDVDAVVARAVEHGATLLRPVKDEFFGDRNGQFMDPWGHKWFVATKIEEVSPEEMQRRWDAAFS